MRPLTALPFFSKEMKCLALKGEVQLFFHPFPYNTPFHAVQNSLIIRVWPGYVIIIHPQSQFPTPSHPRDAALAVSLSFPSRFAFLARGESSASLTSNASRFRKGCSHPNSLSYVYAYISITLTLVPAAPPTRPKSSTSTSPPTTPATHSSRK